MRTALVGVALDPMFEQMFMPRKDSSYMVRLKKRQVALAQLDRLILNVSTSMRARRKGSVVAENDEVNITAAIQSLKLPLNPLVLLFIPGDIAIESHDKRVPVPERIGRIAFQPPRRIVSGNQLRYCIKVIHHSHLSGRLLMIAGSQEIRDPTLNRKAIDEGVETYIPLRPISSIRYGITRLENEFHRIRRIP